MMSWKVTFSRFCRRKSMRRSKWLGSATGMLFSCPDPLARAAPPAPTAVLACAWPADVRAELDLHRGASLFGEHRLDLGLQRLGVEGFDDVVVHARLLGGDDVLGLG